MSEQFNVVGLTELYSDRPGEVGQRVVVVLGGSWSSKNVGTQHLGTIAEIYPDGIRVNFDNMVGDYKEEYIQIRWSYGNRSDVYLLPQPAVEPPPPPQQTFFEAACEFDNAQAALAALKPGYDAALARYEDAATALDAARHRVTESLWPAPKPVPARARRQRNVDLDDL